ncbi:Lrp/AsnC family transcriptional regulator [Persicitalea jodogahamensis]|uniref:AsnC family transcriptional regulator n=1 Tax=Persicitalea jodogahamensis TaxID=402147 RepID=A0A8J3D320_9BACT|nr:Lrp/AsnC family transcriptional regulator [Persicitalea jodogahamensis]GHB65105.1 AsnC family transcriptional regulator [Persicitalea jodogahamensis]
MALDTTDLSILNKLQANAQLTTKEIAAAVNLSVTPVHDRIRKLERAGYIERYVALLNRKKLGKSLVVYCNVTLDKQRKESFEEFNAAVSRLPEVLECSVVSGSFDYLLKVIANDVEAYNAFYQQNLSVLQSVLHISSFFVMSEVKSTTEIPI